MEAAVSHYQRGVTLTKRRIEVTSLHRCVSGRKPPLPFPRERLRRFGPPVTSATRGATGNGSKPPERSEDEEALLNTRKEELRQRLIGRQGSGAQLLPGGVFPADLSEAEELSPGRRDIQRRISSVANSASDRWGRLLYRYYNWRTSVWSDLQLLLVFNAALILLGGITKRLLLGSGAAEGAPPLNFLQDVYQVIKLTLGEDLAENTAPLSTQLFTVVFALAGLVSFALVLTLVEQVILSLVQANVTTGGFIYESGHIVIVAWGSSQRDIEAIWTILRQLCKAYAPEGGRTIVVLSQQPKLEMEANFRRTIPASQRFSTKLVFRQGSPLMPDMLIMVNVTAAASIVIVADSSRKPEEADAQSLRTAVLIDELESPESGGRGGSIVLELRSGRRMITLTQYACSDRVFPVPTTQMNARRIARAVAHPMLAELTKRLWSFSSTSQGYLEHFPQLAGQTFGDLAFFFDDGIVIALINRRTGVCTVTPPPETKITADDELFMMRPTTVARADYQPLPVPIQVTAGAWALEDYLYSRSSVDEEELTLTMDAPVSCSIDNGAPSCSASVYTVPPAYTAVENDEQRILICGWGENSFMCELLTELDRGPVSLAPGSQVTLFNMQDGAAIMARIQLYARLQNIKVNHLRGDPLDNASLAAVNVKGFTAAMVICDATWADPDENSSNGIDVKAQLDFLRLDSMIMMVQINIRQILQEQCPERSEINIVCEKVAYEGVTRFEDRSRLPLGTTVNLTSHGAKFLTQTCYDAHMMLSLYRSSEGIDFRLQECEAFAAEGEELNFWQLQKRVQAVGEALIGWYEVPRKVIQETPIEVVINPRGTAIRNKKRVWNNGDGRMRLYTVGSGVAMQRPKEGRGKQADSAEEDESDRDFERYSRMPLF